MDIVVTPARFSDGTTPATMAGSEAEGGARSSRGSSQDPCCLESQSHTHGRSETLGMRILRPLNLSLTKSSSLTVRGMKVETET